MSSTKEWHKKQLDIYTIINKHKSENYQTQIKSIIIDLKEKVQGRLFGLLESETILSIEAIQEDLDSQIKKLYFINNINHDIIELHKKHYKETFDFLDLLPYSELKKQIDSLKTRTKNINPLETITKHISDAKQTLNEIFETYKNGVKIYTVAAFSVEAKSYIKNLGLSDKLDLIDISELDINNYLTQAEIEIFSNFDLATTKIKNDCSQIYLKLNNISYNSPAISTELNLDQMIAEEAAIINSNILKFDSLNQDFKSKTQNYFSNKIQSINSALVSLKIKKEEALKEINRKRIYYYFKRFIPFLIIFLITVLLFYFVPKFNISNSLSIGNQWILGIITNATSALLTIITSIKKDKHDIYKSEIDNRFLENEKQIVAEILHQGFEEFKINLAKGKSQEINELLQIQSNEILKIVRSHKYNSNNKSLHSTLIANESILKQLLTEYSITLNEFKNVCSRILNNTIHNKNVLLKQSKLIKENSISPSFTLLEQTRDNIAEVKTKIENIDFT